MNRPLPRLAALAVVIHEDAVLLVRRRNPPDAGLWGYPGGHVEPGETVQAAALRELHEETAIIAGALATLSGLDAIGRDGTGTLSHHFYLVPVLCRYGHGTAAAADDADEARWWPVAEVLAGRLPMSAAVPSVLHEAQRHHAR